MILKRVSFKTVPAPDSTFLLALGEPFNKSAVLEALSGDATATRTPGAGDFECVLLEPHAAPEQIAQAEEWLAAPLPHGESAAQRVFVDKQKGAWFLYRGGRAILSAPAAEVNELLAAAAECLFIERELAALEREVGANWTRAETDLPLVNVVGAADLKRMGELSGTARELWLRRIRLARIVTMLAAPAPGLTPRARTFGRRLRRALAIERRSEILDGQLEVYEYIYEMISQRMGEYLNFRHGFVLEILIVVLLALELAVMLWELWQRRSA